jgi:hypothetical protein
LRLEEQRRIEFRETKKSRWKNRRESGFEKHKNGVSKNKERLRLKEQRKIRIRQTKKDIQGKFHMASVAHVGAR